LCIEDANWYGQFYNLITAGFLANYSTYTYIHVALIIREILKHYLG